MNNQKIRRLLAGLRDRAYRALFVETQIETLIPFQIRAMRERRGWTQRELAEHANMAQARISVLENPSYEGAVNVKTLVKLAAAFDVALVVRFARFGELAAWTSELSRDNHDVADYARELAELEAADRIRVTHMTRQFHAQKMLRFDPATPATASLIEGAENAAA